MIQKINLFLFIDHLIARAVNAQQKKMFVQFRAALSAHIVYEYFFMTKYISRYISNIVHNINIPYYLHVNKLCKNEFDINTDKQREIYVPKTYCA